MVVVVVVVVVVKESAAAAAAEAVRASGVGSRLTREVPGRSSRSSLTCG